jgi:hypothetical protein
MPRLKSQLCKHGSLYVTFMGGGIHWAMLGDALRPALSCFAPRPVSRSRPVGLQSLSRSCHLIHEEVALPLGLVDALASDVEIGLVSLNSDEVTAR